jgi:CheY-like chemotaxis protein
VIARTEPLVLIVDDERDNRELLEIVLSSSGLRVMLAASGEEALECMTAQPPDLVLLDLMMPGLSGYDVVRSIKSNPLLSKIPVVMVTALDGPARQSALQAGAEGFLAKPLELAQLKACLAQFLPSSGA